MNSPKEIVKKLSNLCFKEGKFDDVAFKEIIAYLVNNKPTLLRSFKKEIVNLVRKNTVEIISEYELGKSEKTKLEKALEASFFEYKVDPRILGGLIIRNGDKIYDDSIQSQINQLN